MGGRKWPHAGSGSCSQILDVREPWRVERVDLDQKAGEVNVHLTHESGLKWPCPECGEACTLYAHEEMRRWRHLDTCQLRTILNAEPPRTQCSTYGVRAVKLPWAELGSRFTAMFERLAIDWLGAASQSAVDERLGLSWDEVHGIMDRAVRRGLPRRKAKASAHLGVDEKSFTRGHHYFTLVNDLDRGRVLFVGEHRTTETLDEFWSSLIADQIDVVEALAMDMWDSTQMP